MSSSFYCSCQLLLLERFRLHTRREEEEKNLVQLPEVAKGVLLQQFFQAIVVQLLFSLTSGSSPTKEVPQPPILAQLVRFFVAMLAMDAWQYCIHRYMHENKLLYRHNPLLPPPSDRYLRGRRPLQPSARGTLRRHLRGSHIFPRVGDDAEDGCVLLLLLDDQDQRFCLPRYPSLAPGSKYNYSQPFFPFGDKVMGTHMPYTLVDREGGGGFEARPSKMTS
uniref:Uncharacterized protein n=1 Tax=Ananas comosus var. bracteatus TaxID=296719 RepID=A0A6V7NVB2_ANACO|nr:unnamed protein product [Ananas comosus var. bracteatus]